MAFLYDWPRPALTVDICCLSYDFKQDKVNVLLVKRGKEPFKGMWCLPGGHVDYKELPERAATRELMEETNLPIVISKNNLIGVYAQPDRDPRGWYITLSYGIYVNDRYKCKAGDDAVEAEWFSVDNLPPICFCHKEQIEDTCEKLAGFK